MIGDFKNKPGLNLDPGVGPGTQIIDRSSGFRRYALDPEDYAEGMQRVNAYQRLQQMADWALLAPLDFRRWAGQTTAYRDAERSAKVTGDGDPLGLFDPIVGEPLVQEVSADRFIWTQEGAQDAGGSYLTAPALASDGQPHTIIADWRLVDADNDQTNFTAYGHASSVSEIRVRSFSGSSRTIGMRTTTDGEVASIGVPIDNIERFQPTFTVWGDGEAVIRRGGQQSSGAITALDDWTGYGFGARFTGGLPLDIDIRFCAFIGRALTTSEMEKIEAILS